MRSVTSTGSTKLTRAAVRACPIWVRLATAPTVMRPAMSSERTTGRAFMRPSCRHRRASGNPATTPDSTRKTQATCRGRGFAGAMAVPLPSLERIMYGPVRSRRLGTSLGINLLPAGMKICNMNCAYCQYGWTRGAVRYRGQGPGWPTVQAVDSALSARLSAAAERNEAIDRLTVAGHGEPTLHPE